MDSTTKRGRGRPAGLAAGALTVQQVAELLSVSQFTVYSWTRETCQDGRPALPVIRLGRAVRIRPADVDELPARLACRLPRPAPSFFAAKEGLGGV